MKMDDEILKSIFQLWFNQRKRSYKGAPMKFNLNKLQNLHS